MDLPLISLSAECNESFLLVAAKMKWNHMQSVLTCTKSFPSSSQLQESTVIILIEEDWHLSLHKDLLVHTALLLYRTRTTTVSREQTQPHQGPQRSPCFPGVRVSASPTPAIHLWREQ